MISLPKSPVKPSVIEARKLFLYSNVKVGKSSLCLQLPNSLLIDLEGGAAHYEGTYIDVKKEAMLSGKGAVTYLKEIVNAISEENKNAGKPVYDFIIIDTTTALEEMAVKVATHEYRKTVAGKNFTGTNVVTQLAKGAGYGLLKDSYSALYQQFSGLAGKCLILLGHVKLSSMDKKGEAVQITDVQLTGSLKLMVSMDMDANGFMYRKKGTTQNIVSFITSEDDITTGSRIPYLSNREIVISELDEKGNLVTYWDQIFPSIKA